MNNIEARQKPTPSILILLNIGCRNIIYDQKGPINLRITHMLGRP